MSEKKSLIAHIDDQPQMITIDLKRLRMRDLNKMKDSSDSSDWATIVPIIARVTSLTEDQVWDLDIETLITVQTAISNSMDDVLKKTNAGS